MTTENKIKCVLMDFEINKITLQEATKQILRLFSVVGRSEQLVCDNHHADLEHFMNYSESICKTCKQKV